MQFNHYVVLYFFKKDFGFGCFVPICVINFPDLQLAEKTLFFRDLFCDAPAARKGTMKFIGFRICNVILTISYYFLRFLTISYYFLQCFTTPYLQNPAFQPSRGRLHYIHPVRFCLHSFYCLKNFNEGQKPNLLYIWGSL